MKILMPVITPILLSFCLLQSCENKSKGPVKTDENATMQHQEPTDAKDMHTMHTDLKASIDKNMAQMKEMKMTGDFDLDFANMMIMHHQAAIDMSEVELAKGSDVQAKGMAKNIINTQKMEIIQMQEIVSKLKMKVVKTEHGEMHNEMGESMKMMEGKMMNMQMSSNIDRDFIMMMIPHHESAVMMAKDEIAHGKNGELKKLAQQIITDQTREIADFNAWLASH